MRNHDVINEEVWELKGICDAYVLRHEPREYTQKHVFDKISRQMKNNATDKSWLNYRFLAQKEEAGSFKKMEELVSKKRFCPRRPHDLLSTGKSRKY